MLEMPGEKKPAAVASLKDWECRTLKLPRKVVNVAESVILAASVATVKPSLK